MKPKINHTFSRCAAINKNNLRCASNTNHGLLCARHARYVCGAGTGFRYHKIVRHTLQFLDDEEIEVAAKSYLSGGGIVDLPTNLNAYSSMIYDMLKVNEGTWVDCRTIGKWLEDWTKQDINQFQVGSIMRTLTKSTYIQRRKKTTVQYRLLRTMH